MVLERYNPTKAERLRTALSDAVLAEGVVTRTSPEPVQVVDLKVGDRHTFAVGGRVLVESERLDEAASRLKARDQPRAVSGAWHEVLLPDGLPIDEALDALRTGGEVILGRPHHVCFGAQIFAVRIREGQDPEPEDPSREAQAFSVPEADVPVAVVDNGVAKSALSTGWLADLANDPSIGTQLDPLDEWSRRRGTTPLCLDEGAGHGTFVAGVIRQLAPTAALHVLRRLDSRGVGTEEDLADGIRAAVAAGARVVNLSVGCYTADGLPPALLEEAITQSLARDVVFVAAAGNETSREPVWPAALRPVVAVAALDEDWDPRVARLPALAPYSNRGWWVDASVCGTWSSVFVHGRENDMIETEGPPDDFHGWARSAGTSFAAAAFSGMVAAELHAGAATARDAVRQVIRRPGAIRIPEGGYAVPIG